MKFPNSCSSNQAFFPAMEHRAGIIAIGEVMVVLVSLTSLFWVGSQLLPAVFGESNAAKLLFRGCSERSVHRLSVDLDGQRMWVYRPHEGVVRLNLSNGDYEQVLPLSVRDLSALAHSGDGAMTLLCGHDDIMAVTRDGQGVLLGQSSPSRDVIVDAAVSSDGSLAVCITPEGFVRGCHFENGEFKEICYQLNADSWIVRMRLCKSGRRMCVTQSDGAVTFYDPETGTPEVDGLKFDAPYNAFAWSDDGRFLAFVDDSGRVQMHDARSLNCIWKTPADPKILWGFPMAIVFSPDGKWIATSSNGSTDVLVYAVASSHSARRLQGHEGIVRTLQFAPDSGSLYSGSFDGTIREWSTETWMQVRVVD